MPPEPAAVESDPVPLDARGWPCNRGRLPINGEIAAWTVRSELDPARIDFRRGRQRILGARTHAPSGPATVATDEAGSFHPRQTAETHFRGADRLDHISELGTSGQVSTPLATTGVPTSRRQRPAAQQPIAGYVVQRNTIAAAGLDPHRHRHVNTRSKSPGTGRDHDRGQSRGVRHQRLFRLRDLGFLHLGGSDWSAEAEPGPRISCARQKPRREGGVAQARPRLLPTHRCGGIRRGKI